MTWRVVLGEGGWIRCIPYRYRPAGDNKTVEVLMITSQRGEGLLFPKVCTPYASEE
jgi:hypothetical protein